MQSWELFRTNPVLVLERLIGSRTADPVVWAAGAAVLQDLVEVARREGQPMSGPLLRRLAELDLLDRDAPLPEPCRIGVCGLVHASDGPSLVVPLRAKRAEGWRADAVLPIDGDRLLGLLRGLLRAAGIHGVLPEVDGHVLGTEFPERSAGRSMDVAALLSVLDAAAGEPDLLAAACAVVEPAGEEGLRSVGEVAAKLQAFRREQGRGSLLVRHPDCRAAAAYDADFGEVWQVRTLAELATRCMRSGLLTPWRSAALDARALDHLLLRLRILSADQDHRSVRELGRRARAAGWKADVSPLLRMRVLPPLLASLRHLGQSIEADAVGAEWELALQDAGHAASFDEQAEQAVERAACWFDLGRHDEIVEVLGDWLGRIRREPRLLRADLRVRVQNTAARALLRSGRHGWRELLEESLLLQRTIDPAGMSRTRAYLIEGCLRDGDLAEAETLIGVLSGEPLSDFARSMLGFYRADLARRRGELQVDPDLEDRAPSDQRPNHAQGFYLQATARQPGRAAADAEQRYLRAAGCFAFDREADGAPNVLNVLVAAMELAAAERAADVERKDSARQVLRGVLDAPGFQALRTQVLAVDGPFGAEGILEVLPWL